MALCATYDDGKMDGETCGFQNVKVDFAVEAKKGYGCSMVQAKRRHTQIVIGGYGGG